MHSSPKNLKTKIIPKRFRAWFLASFLLASASLSGFFVFQSASAATGINQMISFQGKVVNSNGTNVTNGSYTFVFQLYTVSSGGTNIWTETKSLTVTDGIFQTDLGDTTALPGSVDFNTDNIYLGINFNSDGEMSPRVRFTAAPYAFNAKKVGGLTVTDTTGTLTIPNGKTIAFADAFTTTGAFPLTLTTTASTTATLPSGTITLADLTTAQSLTNKTIGSTGLVFSGASTDMTTATNEDLNITANGTGDIVIAVDSGTFVNLTGGADGTGALTVAAGDVTLSDGDLIISGGDANFTLDAADTFNVIKSSANAGDVVNITASSVNAIDGLQLDLTATTDAGADNVSGIDIAWTESADADVWTAVNLPNTTTTNSNTRAFVVGTGYDTILDSANLDISGTGVITGATGITSSGTITFSGLTAGGVVSAAAGTGVLSVGTLGAASITADTLDFTEFKDTMALDAALVLNQSTNTWSQTFTGTTTNGYSYTANSLTTGSALTLTSTNTATTNTALSAIQFNLTNAQSTLANTNGIVGATLNFTNNPTIAGNTEYAFQIQNQATTNTTDNAVAALLRLDNADTTATGTTVVTDAILITNSGGSSFTNFLNTPTLDISAAGAITGATGVSTTTLTASSTIDAQGDISDSTGNLTLNDAVDISGNLIVSGATLTATSATTITLGSTGADTIILGNAGADTITIGNVASTGVSIVDNNWSVTTAGVGTFITGTVIGSQTFTTNNIADSGALTIASGSATALTLNSGTNGAINIGTDASAETINIGNTGAAVKTIAIGNNSQANTITIGDASVTSLSLTDNNWSISTAGAAAFASLSSSGAIAANGGITFDNTTDTIGAFTAAGTIDMNTNILTNIGNTGTDFVASTGALTLAGVLTANGGISLSGSQSLAAAALSYVDLGLIVHNTSANQGLRLPNAASASPSSPTSGEGYLAWDAAGNQLITYNGSAWTTVGGTSTLDGAYTAGNTITTDSGSNVIITLQEVVTPTSFVVENQDTAGVSAERIYNSIASGTLTNGLLLEQTGAGTMTNAIQIAETAGTITDGILVTGTLGNILNTPTLDITGGGAITGATGITSSGTITFSSISGSTQCLHVNTSGVVSGTGSDCGSGSGMAIGGTVTSGTTGSILFVGSGPVLAQDNASFFFDDTNNRLGLGTTSPAAQLSILGTTNALRLSYDVSNYASLSTASDGTLSLTSSNTSESQFVIGTGASVDDSVGFDGASQDYYAGLDHTSGYFTIGTGFTVGSSTLFAIDSTGNIGIGTGVTAPAARLDLSLSSTNTTADTLYAQRNVLSDTGIVTTGTDTTYGVNTSVTRTGATGGTLNTYGNYISVTADNAGSGTSTAYGLYSAVTGADTNYAGIFTGGNVGVGDTTPDNPFEILSTSQQLRLSYTDGSVDGAIYVDSSEYLTLVAGTTSEVNRVQIGAGGAGNSTPDLFGLDVKSDTGDPAGGFEGAMYYNTLDNVFRCYQNTGWTNCIGSGGSSDLQTTYATDADGSNATISLTAADDGLIITNPSSSGNDLSAFTLQVSQLNTTAAITTLDLIQASNAANAVDITANSIDTEFGLTVTANALTSGKALNIASSSTAFTGSLANFTLSGSNAANTGSLVAIDNTGTSNANTSLYIKHYATGTNNLAFRVDDVSGDTTPFVIDGTGAVGIGTTAPTSLFELYGTTAADIVATLTAPDTTYDPVMKFRTGSSPAVQFTLGVDNSDSDKFKIYSGDGLGSGDEFVIDSNGVTTIANLNLGATNFDTDAGIISWVDMPVTASSPDNTVESYTALLDGQSMLSLYALSDGAGSIDTRRVQLGDGGAGVAQPVLLGLDVRSSTGDPTDGFEGAMYYNTVDNVFRCYQNTGWTNCIGAGGSTDLQTAYGNDADGSNVTISLTAADDGLIFTNPTSSGNNLSTFLLQLDQANTTANMLTLDIIQASNASNAVNITANAIDGETGLAITSNGLTSGKGISIASSATAFTGNLADVSLTGSNAANTGNVLAVSNTGTANANTAVFVDHRATGTGNLAMRVNDESGDTTPFIIDGDGRVGIGTTAIATDAATERLLQVGSATNRGNAAVYGEIISKGLDQHTALTGIKDVFVYDTTGDSDGGRWIDWATTDNLSWYTEALDDGPNDPCSISSDDRCYKASFPRKAILVVTTSALYIFDAATNDMWMKFNQNASVYALGADTNNDPSSVTALNGVIYVGANGSSAGGLYVFDFVNDRMWNYNGTNRAAANTGISGRNGATTYDVDPDTKLEISPVGTAAEWERVNDVSATVITHSLSAVAIGAATNTTPGNGKVFVTLATDSGVTVINTTDKVLVQYSDVTADDYTAAVISRKGFLYALNTTQDQLERWDAVDTQKTTQVNQTYSRKWDETVATGPALASTSFNILAGYPDNLEIAERASATLDSEDIIYVGHSLGLAELHDHTTQAFGWVKYFNTTRQTPMMFDAGINDMVLPMDDTSGTQAQDLSIANTDMAILGTPTLGVNGVAGKAINFDNTNDYLCSDADQNNVCDVDTAFNMSTVGWTFSIWFRHSTTAPATAADTIFEKCVTATPGKATGCVIAYMTTTGTIVVANDTDATWTRPDEGAASYNITATSTYAYNDNQWHHLVLSRTNANDLDSWIDGNGMNLSTATGGTTTFDGSQIVSIGASCVLTVTANCGAVVNAWDGQLDDAQFVVGTTTQATLSAMQVRRLYNLERPRASKRTVTVTDATSATSTSLTDTGESWYANELAGLIVEITGSTDTDCVGITRRISSNTATSLTFTPAVPGACTLDTTADFQVDPESLYGASDAIAGIGITAETPLGEARQMCIGTNSGSDTGGVTCYNHQAGPSIVADVYHSQASQTDNSGTDWTGSNYDEMISIDLSTRTLIMASEAHFTSVTEDVRLGQGLDYVANQLYMIRQEIMLDGVTAVGSTAPEVGFTGGADLAENYYSDTPLEAGTVVALHKTQQAFVDPTKSGYQKDMLGVVATSPGIVLGDPETNGYPIALVGRVPVKVTNENGPIYAGDRLTSASRSGFAMRAVQSGRVLGEALGDAVDWTVCDGEDPLNHEALLCTTVLVFVNLTDYSGQSVELAMAERNATQGAGLTGSATLDGADQGMGTEGGSIRLVTSMPTRQEQILSFLKELRDTQVAQSRASSEVFTGRVSASTEVITPTLYADQIFAKNIKADSIEGLSIWTNQIASLEEKYAGLVAETPTETPADTTSSPAQTLLNLEKLSVGSMAVSLDATILGKLSLTGGMTVGGTAQFEGETVFARLANFLGRTIFKGQVSFESSPVFGQDTAGFAVIEAGAQKVRVTFETPYEKQPIVAVTLTNDASPLSEGADEVLKQDIEILEHEYVQSVFDEDVRYLVTEKSPRGFTIVLSQSATRDLQFSWVALSVDKVKSFSSEKVKVPVVDPVGTIVPETPQTMMPAEEPLVTNTSQISEPLPQEIGVPQEAATP